MGSLALPQDIILLLCEELATRRDFGTLFQVSLVSRRVASIALEKLYSIQELSPVCTGDAYSKLEWSRLWRSIILSSIESTAYPYCAYVRALSLGNLEECLQDMMRDQNIRDFFFGGPMERFLVLREGLGRYTRQQPMLLDPRQTMVKCADSVTEYIKRVADDTGTAVALAHLEGTSFPHDLLPSWIARLGTLTSLRIRDGSVLGVEAASAISECCPNFVDLTCYYYQSSTADEDLAAFFQTLRPNSLRSFQIISQNGIGESALTALNAHAVSLRSLILRSLPPQAMKALNSLPKCTALETLFIENDRHNQVNLKDFSQGMLKEVRAWVSSCKSLRHLSFNHVLNALPIVMDVLSMPDIRLTSLSVVDFIDSFPGTEGERGWAALGSQDRLESLTLSLQDHMRDPSMLGDNLTLLHSILKLKSLTSLNLMQSYVVPDDIRRFAQSLPNLSEFHFTGDIVEDPVLTDFAAFPQLKLLSINAPSMFTFSGLQQFARQLNTLGRRGIRVDILNQYDEMKFTDSQYTSLQNYFSNTLKGRIEITYELPEADLSDLSD